MPPVDGLEERQITFFGASGAEVIGLPSFLWPELRSESTELAPDEKNLVSKIRRPERLKAARKYNF
ncbi:hypothetical protein N7539_007581 [Penicillium diatomitis]|uniref:Uncharacterized protein n=1 Tax=Penicillium diatomitis TaxID=2819901 RepID=A0A9W9WVR3_9EURO|nr:uncharacterized protein N7539_007581 [Penicillium diatomitis]KAJ5477437.1 hypothetical protein N7539_007581 [Penicillium diatomitis]